MIKVTGDLTIKGMTNEITFNTTMNLEDDVKKQVENLFSIEQILVYNIEPKCT